MALIDRIEKLRAAPVQKRRVILIISVATIMVCIVGIWMLSLQSSLDLSDSSKESATPLKLIRENVKNALKYIRTP